MQSEQQTTTSQTKKPSSGVKKDKKSSKPKAEGEENMEQKVETQVSTPVPTTQTSTKASVSTPVVTLASAVVAKQEDDVKASEDSSAVAQEMDVNTIIDFLNNASDKLADFSKYFKDNSLSKEERAKVETGFKKFFKSTSTLQNGYTDFLSRQVSVLEKSSGSKSTGVKKVTDKEKSAIHKKLNVQPFLLNFMKLEPNTQVSRSDALTAITGYVKQEKIKNPDIIVANDKRSFKLIGELKTLFSGIEGVMKSSNLLEGKTMPTEIKYTQIMQYMTHCFIKAK